MIEAGKGDIGDGGGGSANKAAFQTLTHPYPQPIPTHLTAGILECGGDMHPHIGWLLVSTVTNKY